MVEVAEFIAEFKGVTVKELAEITTQTSTLFSLARRRKPRSGKPGDFTLGGGYAPVATKGLTKESSPNPQYARKSLLSVSYCGTVVVYRTAVPWFLEGSPMTTNWWLFLTPAQINMTSLARIQTCRCVGIFLKPGSNIASLVLQQ